MILQRVYYIAAYNTSDSFTESRAESELAFTSDVSGQQSRCRVVASKFLVGSQAAKRRCCYLG